MWHVLFVFMCVCPFVLSIFSTFFVVKICYSMNLTDYIPICLTWFSLIDHQMKHHDMELKYVMFVLAIVILGFIFHGSSF